MLAAQNQDNQLESENQPTNTRQPSGFGKVLGSLHGLQQRLDDFSIEDISNADAKVKSLIQQITFIRGHLGALAELKRSMTAANEIISSIPEENFDLISPDGLEKHPQLHAIVQASKLIRFYRLMQAARASADAISIDTGSPAMVVPATGLRGLATESSQENSQPIPAQESIAALGSDDQVPESAVAIVAPAQTDTLSFEPIPASEAIEVSERTPPAPLATNTERESASAISPVSAIDSIMATADSPALPPELQMSNATEASTHLSEKNFVLIAADAAQASVPPTTSLAIIEKPEAHATEKTNSQPRGVKNRSKKKKHAEASSAQNSDAKGAATLDQRLLDDLIKQYGDFAVTPNLPAPIETAKKSKPKPAPVVAANIPEFDGPIFEDPILDNKNSGQVQKAGELDRQLKKIIKDYGEYDIYSRHSAVNLKTGGIIAFVVLGLVLGGLYLFKSPARIQTPQSQSEPSAPSNASQDGKSDSTLSNKNASGGQNGAVAGTSDSNAKQSAEASKTVSKIKK